MGEFLIVLGDILMVVGVILLAGLLVFWYLLKRFNDRLEAELDNVLKQVEDRIIGLEVEVDDNQYFVYNAKDKSFICQGKTAEDILLAFKDRYPNDIGHLVNSHDENLADLVRQFSKIKNAR